MVELRLRILATALVLLAPGVASAQPADGFRLDRYQAPPTVEDGLALQLPDTLGHQRWSAGLVLDYAHAPLVLGDPDGGRDSGGIVEHRLMGHLVGALGLLDWLELHVRLPVVLTQSGDSPSRGAVTFDSPSGAAIGDPSLGGSARLYGERDEGLSLGLTASLFLPVGDQDALAGDGSVGVSAAMLAAYAVPRTVTFAAEAGVGYRPARDYGTSQVGTELLYGLGAYVPATEALTLSAELRGAAGLREDQTLSRLGSANELYLGGRYRIGGVVLSAGVGVGLTQAPGVPDVRGLLGVGYAPPRPAALEAATPTGDRDGDGIPDAIDQCPDEPEDRDGWQDEDGCPDPDNDGDGIPDTSDRCPDEAEVINGFEDEDGCPDEAPEEAELRGLTERILFPVNGVRPTRASGTVVRGVAQLIEDNPHWTRITIEGHADSTGGSDYNLDLSRRRAEHVRTLLVRRGVDGDRLEVVAHGDTRPDVQETDAEARALNRRVIFTVVERAAGGRQR